MVSRQVSVGTGKMIGFLLAICGNTLIACSLTLQKSAHNKLASPPTDPDDKLESAEPNTPGPPPDTFRFLKDPTWWMGTFLMAAGEVGNFAAFGFAPASLVAPLGAWSVVLSAVLAHVFLHEVVSHRNLLGIALCIVGAFLIGAAGPDVSDSQTALDASLVLKLLVRPPFVVFIVLTLTAVAVLVYLAHRTTLGQRYIFVYVGVSSLLGGVTVVCAKALSTFLRLTLEGNSQFGNWLPFALVVTLAVAILAQLRYLNLAMAQFGNSQVIPVYYVLFTSCAMSSGVIMYREFDALTLGNIPFFLGICSTMSGVFLVSRSAKPSDSPSSEKLSVDSIHVKINDGADYEPMLPVSPMSSPRSSVQQSPWP